MPSTAAARDRTGADPVVVPSVVLVPVKRLEVAKSRLGPLGDVVRRELALAFALDTLELALAAPGVVRVVAVTDDPTVAAGARALGAGTAPDVGDLNLALRAAGAAARAATGAQRLLALCADLPSLTAEDLGALVTDPAARGLVVDHRGLGTTALLSDDAWRPAFGAGSARRHHASGYPGLGGSPRLRTDVDTPDDLVLATALGLGARSAGVVARLTA